MGDVHLTQELSSSALPLCAPPALAAATSLAVRDKPSDMEESFLSRWWWPGCPLCRVGHISFECLAKGIFQKSALQTVSSPWLHSGYSCLNAFCCLLGFCEACFLTYSNPQIMERQAVLIGKAVVGSQNGIH